MNKTHVLDREMLYQMYVIERLSTREIGRRMGVSKHPVIDALAEFGISARIERTKGHRPTDEELRRWVLEDNRTLTDIASETGAHPTGVRWWLRQANIPWDGTLWGQRNRKLDRNEPTADELRRLYWEEGRSLEETGAAFGMTRMQMAYRFREYGIGCRPDGWTGKRFSCHDGHRVRSSYEQRVDNWLFEHDLLHQYEPPLRGLGGTSMADFMVGDTYIEIWGVSDSSDYKARRAVKMAWYSQEGLDVLHIGYWDFCGQAKGRWTRKLERLLTPD